ncbi:MULTISPECIES: hypothetical protein [Luteimonas]|uniref:hypothetical protein n=1 Tax=Luteimonas TaxID=83614 RepID=UPI000C79568B|nr:MULTISPECIES: hypothetical protein [Luteimonas]
MPALLAAFFAAVGPWIARFMMVKGVLIVAGFMARLGVVLATNEFAMEPLIEHVTTMWMTIPAGMQCWLSLLGVTKVASIMVTGMTLIGFKRVFIARA